jgi:hypothetical protein
VGLNSTHVCMVRIRELPPAAAAKVYRPGSGAGDDRRASRPMAGGPGLLAALAGLILWLLGALVLLQRYGKPSSSASRRHVPLQQP